VLLDLHLSLSTFLSISKGIFFSDFKNGKIKKKKKKKKKQKLSLSLVFRAGREIWAERSLSLSRVKVSLSLCLCLDRILSAPLSRARACFFYFCMREGKRERQVFFFLSFLLDGFLVSAALSFQDFFFFQKHRPTKEERIIKKISSSPSSSSSHIYRFHARARTHTQRERERREGEVSIPFVDFCTVVSFSAIFYI